MSQYLYLYGIISPNAIVPPYAGIEPSFTLWGVSQGQVQVGVRLVDPALFEIEQAGEAGQRLAELAVAHDACISQLMEQTTILPAPFASLLPNEPALRQLMQQEEQRWQALLEDVSGCVEMGLRAFVNHAGTYRLKS